LITVLSNSGGASVSRPRGAPNVLFITRELLEFQQLSDVPFAVRKKKWDDAANALQQHYATVKDKLNSDMRAFIERTLHDGVVEHVYQPTMDTVSLEINGHDCPQPPRGMFLLTFRGVKCAEGLDECIGFAWLYEEVHLHPEARFDYQVLLRNGTDLLELRIVADEVEFRITEQGPSPVVGVDIPFKAADGLYFWSNLDESGTTMGWCCLTVEGELVPKCLSPEVRETLRKFAAGTGAVIPDELREKHADQSGGRSE
jgi:hypothetical protein